MRLFPSTLLSAACAFALCSAALADTVYNSAGAYASATSAPSTTINFNNIAPAGSFVEESNPFTLSGSTFSFVTSADAFVIDPGYEGSSYSGGGFLSVDYSSTGFDSLIVTLPSVTALSFNYGGLLSAPGNFDITLSDGFNYNFGTGDSVAGTGTLDFLGVTSTTPLTSITFTLPDTPGYNALDNLTFASTAAQTPEPASVLLLASGALAVLGVARRRMGQA